MTAAAAGFLRSRPQARPVARPGQRPCGVPAWSLRGGPTMRRRAFCREPPCSGPGTAPAPGRPRAGSPRPLAAPPRGRDAGRLAACMREGRKARRRPRPPPCARRPGAFRRPPSRRRAAAAHGGLWGWGGWGGGGGGHAPAIRRQNAAPCGRPRIRTGLQAAATQRRARPVPGRALRLDALVQPLREAVAQPLLVADLDGAHQLPFA